MTKPTKWHVHPANTQISLGICPVWSESLLSAWRKLKSLTTHRAHSEDWSDWADAQADLSLRWAHSHFVGFVMRRLIFIFLSYSFYRLLERVYSALAKTLIWSLNVRLVHQSMWGMWTQAPVWIKYFRILNAVFCRNKLWPRNRLLFF